MGVTKEGAIKIAAQKIGISVAVYEDQIQCGLKWCYRCKSWKFRDNYSSDRSRGDGLKADCRQCSKVRYIKSYQPKPKRVFKGRSFTPARDEDKKQARRRINYFVESGIIEQPNNLPCADCGHIYVEGGPRHEYDHYLGYAAENHEKVEAVCSGCHHKREINRRRHAKA